MRGAPSITTRARGRSADSRREVERDLPLTSRFAPTHGGDRTK
jgi:hypothetical protein